MQVLQTSCSAASSPSFLASSHGLRVARAHQRRQLLAQHRWRRIGDDEVESVVDVTLPLRLLVVLFDALPQGLPARLQRKRQNGGVAARGRAAGAALETIRHHNPRTLGLVEMDVAVDSAGQNQQARSVDLGGGAWQIVCERDDAAVFHANVAFADVSGGDNRSAADNQIKLHSHHLWLCAHKFRSSRRKIHANCAHREAGCKTTLEPS